jgi:hypothetical protein
MELWVNWYWCARQLRPAFSRTKTFLWALLVLAGFATRQDQAGVTSIVRGLALKETAYRALLRFFHSDAVKMDILTDCWIGLVMKIFHILTVGDYLTLALDGLKIPKEGKKMPAVKCLHQESNNNSKAEYIMGHSFQCLAILARGFGGAIAAIPLISQIHEGLVWSNRDQQTLIDKAAKLVAKARHTVQKSLLIIADAYYCNAKFIRALLDQGCQLISRVRNNAVAYFPPKPAIKKKRGRPKKYGKKVRLASFFDKPELFVSALSPVYGETNVEIRYFVINLIWPPIKRMMRFVLVDHPTRGKSIFTSSDLSLDPLIILQTYGYRYKIELSFKHALRIIGTYAYHFWMKAMDPIKRYSGDQYLHKKTQAYRKSIQRKMKAYAAYVTMGCVAQGLLLHLSLNHAELVWRKFGSWLRTMKMNVAPSELVAATALRNTLPEFIGGRKNDHAFKKFLCNQLDAERGDIFRLAG